MIVLNTNTFGTTNTLLLSDTPVLSYSTPFIPLCVSSISSFSAVLVLVPCWVLGIFLGPSPPAPEGWDKELTRNQHINIRRIIDYSEVFIFITPSSLALSTLLVSSSCPVPLFLGVP